MTLPKSLKDVWPPSLGPRALRVVLNSIDRYLWIPRGRGLQPGDSWTKTQRKLVGVHIRVSNRFQTRRLG
ncbi:hypothetical protein LCGC14_2797960 [marine sediment metagenome]|uniref:Uncharacterized protein n=1 Tax=marine sediment metagenome TaxID=412755 RepID=A0A0F9BEY2_9ZZZZ